MASEGLGPHMHLIHMFQSKILRGMALGLQIACGVIYSLTMPLVRGWQMPWQCL